MKAVIQRVKSAEVYVDGQVAGKIGKAFWCSSCGKGDGEGDLSFLASKIPELRNLRRQLWKFNLSLKELHNTSLRLRAEGRRTRRVPAFPSSGQRSGARQLRLQPDAASSSPGSTTGSAAAPATSSCHRRRNVRPTPQEAHRLAAQADGRRLADGRRRARGDRASNASGGARSGLRGFRGAAEHLVDRAARLRHRQPLPALGFADNIYHQALKKLVTSPAGSGPLPDPRKTFLKMLSSCCWWQVSAAELQPQLMMLGARGPWRSSSGPATQGLQEGRKAFEHLVNLPASTGRRQAASSRLAFSFWTSPLIRPYLPRAVPNVRSTPCGKLIFISRSQTANLCRPAG